MSRPEINVIINFSTGAIFGNPFILDQSQLGSLDVLADSTALIVDVSNLVDTISTNRGRQLSAEQFNTGTASVRILDQNGDFNSQNTASPYYSYLSPMRKIAITATYLGVTYPIYAGYITAYSTSTPRFTGDLVYTTISAVDGFRLFQNAQFFGVTGATAGETTGSRVTKILDTIGWPASMRDIDTGQTTVQADPATQRTALSALQTVATTEFGAIYMGADGKAVFQDRAVTAGSIGGTAKVFSDDGSGIGYNNVLWVFDDTQIYNLATITRTGGSVQTVSDSASIAQYFTHSYNQSGLLMQTDAEALNYAQSFVASRKDTAVRVDSLTLDLQQDNYDAGTIAGLDLDFFDPVKITTSQPNSTLTKTVQIFGVAMQIKPDSWKVNFTTAEPIIDAFILDSTLYGILGTSVLSY
jgi:hypothetical protein